MRALAGILKELAALFVDDGALALAILGIIVLAAILATLMPGAPVAAGAVLLFGCLGVLLANVTLVAQR